MFLPYRTDAPVYHWPWGTIGLIALNVVVFGMVASGSVDSETAGRWVLWHDQGLRPTQWVTSSFMHLNLLHLAGNMMFLWVFGLVVEGKLGWLKFLPCYLGIGVVQCGLEQVVTNLVGLDGYTLGASAILFGLLAMALVWAPENEVDVFYWIGLRMGTVSLRIRTMAFIYAALEGLQALLGWAAGAGLTSAVLHLSGAALGLPLGVVLLRRGAVDCEGWDIFSLRGGKPREVKLHRPGPARERAPAAGETAPQPEDRAARAARAAEERSTALQLVKEHLREGSPELAAEAHDAAVRATGPWPLEEPLLRSLIKGFRDARKLGGAKPYLEEYVERFPARATPMRLLLAKLLIEEERRPAKALEVLEAIGDAPPLDETHRRLRDRLAAEARRLRDEGVLELE
ncbi:MAG: rhomboid family intramembrane serine protease [Planctomycetes bacterium]|nr:rhomboid family intramembrane serine protease [Planctomycetota bacterium]